LIPDKPEKSWTSSKQTVMPGHNVRPGQAFASQKLKFTGHLSDDRLLFAGLDNVQRQISEHNFPQNGGYCVYYPSNLFHNTRCFENWGIFSDIPQF